MKNFAKLFDSPTRGQILARIDRNEEGDPALFVHFLAFGGNFATMSFNMEDSDESWDKLEQFIEDLTLEKAEEFLKGTKA